MEQLLVDHIGELIVGSVLMLLAWGFKAWSVSIKDATISILDKLDYLTKEFHQHRVDIERRITRVETKATITDREP